MRAGVAVSVIGHVGAVMITLMAWPASQVIESSSSTVVPIEIVNMAAESNVRALAEDVPEDEVAPEEQETVEADPAPAPSPTAARTPQPRQQREEFDLDSIARMVNTETKTGRERQDGERADRNQRGAGLGTAEVASLEARIASISSQVLNRCWRSVADLPDPQRLRVVLEIRLNRDGSLNGQPRVVSPTNYTFDPIMNEAVNRAQRAVRQCDPIERLPQDPVVGEHYNLWRQQEVEFRVRN